MSVSYKKLWKLMIDKDMSKTDLRLAIGASSATVAKLTNAELVSSEVLSRICQLFRCDIGDIMELKPSELHNLGSSINCLGRRVTTYTTRDPKEIAKVLAVI